jgi:acyl-CoA reductase-like NAD-dependent aldehyde dehydrogenase
MYVAGNWTDSDATMSVIHPFTGGIVDEVPKANFRNVDEALVAAERGAQQMKQITAYERCQIFHRAAELLSAQLEDLARTITLEEGKPLNEARGEVGRMPDLLRLCAFEGTQARGETLPLDAQAGARGKLGITLRVPCGIVVAITPFNYPLLLVVHKIGPALAAGNAVILKPAERTPLTALKLTRIFLEAGLPADGLQCVTGSGPELGPLLCSDSRVRKISFTGSVATGEQIARIAGLKRLSLELGSNSPVIVLSDADVETVADATSVAGYVNAGQVCISVQRVLVDRKVYSNFLDALKPRVESLRVGDPFAEETKVSAMISEPQAARVDEWISEARSAGAQVIAGGQRDGAVYAPSIVAGVTPEMRVMKDELFGPAVAVMAVDGPSEAIQIANDSRYGLGAGVFTRDIGVALRFAREIHSGTVMVNGTPLWRADLMPYGGFKNSGIGKEGPRYAVEEMTEIKTVVFHGVD